jgi:hypothetical protein
MGRIDVSVSFHTYSTGCSIRYAYIAHLKRQAPRASLVARATTHILPDPISKELDYRACIHFLRGCTHPHMTVFNSEQASAAKYADGASPAQCQWHRLCPCPCYHCAYI